MTGDVASVIENLWIPMSDGVRLAARLWLPSGAAASAVPAIIEAHPYRKRDFWRPMDEAWGSQLTVAGYAFVRIDLRGTGDSDGFITDEYSVAEQQDIVAAIEWVAGQSWCSGAVGMRGLSWGGFAALQAATRAPAALKAISIHCASDDRFTDDCHFVGGALARENFKWGLLFKCFAAMPPDAQIVGDRWRDMWQRRLNAAEPVIANWTSHQRADEYWRQGSINAARVQCPVHLTSGWLDAYVDPVPRLLQRLTVPCKAVIGPWGHTYPSFAEPGPSLDWAVVETRWWDHWLKNVDNGVLQEPVLQVFMPTAPASRAFPQPIPGHWIAEAKWPSKLQAERKLYLDAGKLQSEPQSPRWLGIPDDIVGLQKRDWLLMRVSAEELPGDQGDDDLRSLVFDSAPLKEDLEILGSARLVARIRANQPMAQLAIRLNGLGVDRTSRLVSYGILNLTHREQHAAPRALVPGEPVLIELPLYFRAHRFAAGSRIRVALSQGLWPLVWPAPAPAQVEIETGSAALVLPTRPITTDEQPTPIAIVQLPAGAPAGTRTMRANSSRDGERTPGRHVSIDIQGPARDGRVTVHEELAMLRPEVPDAQLTIRRRDAWDLQIQRGDPNSCRWNGALTFELSWPDRRIEVGASFQLRSTPTEYVLNEALTATEDGTSVFQRSWSHRIPRDLT